MGEIMDWDQIESKWAAMARRVRADKEYIPRDLSARASMRSIALDGRAMLVADRQLNDAAASPKPMPK